MVPLFQYGFMLLSLGLQQGLQPAAAQGGQGRAQHLPLWDGAVEAAVRPRGAGIAQQEKLALRESDGVCLLYTSRCV